MRPGSKGRPGRKLIHHVHQRAVCKLCKLLIKLCPSSLGLLSFIQIQAVSCTKHAAHRLQPKFTGETFNRTGSSAFAKLKRATSSLCHERSELRADSSSMEEYTQYCFASEIPAALGEPNPPVELNIPPVPFGTFQRNRMLCWVSHSSQALLDLHHY